MDLQLTLKEVCSHTTEFDSVVEQAIDGEYTLPDFCPDIKKILKCTLTPYIHNISVSGNVITADGTAHIHILYLSGNKKEIRGYDIQSSFTKNIDIRKSCDDYQVNCTAKCEYVNCRAVNERKLDIHGAASVRIYCTRQNKQDIVSQIDCADIQTRCDQISFSEPVSHAEKLILLNEEISLDESNGSILNIISGCACVDDEEYKAVTNKVVYKANLSVRFTYLNEDGTYETVTRTLPVSQIIESDGMFENVQIFGDSKICGLELKPYTDRNGNCMSVLVNAKVRITVRAWQPRSVSSVSDAYSTQCELNKSECTANLLNIGGNIGVSESLRRSFDIEGGVSDIICADFAEPITEITTEGDNISIKGSIPVGIIYISVEGECCYSDKIIEFETARQADREYNRFETVCKAENCSFTLNSENSIELRCDLKIELRPSLLIPAQLMSGIEKDTERLKSNDGRPAMTLYFAKKGESVWDIAMRYNTRADDIMVQNELTSDILPSSKMLIIPGIA